ncbi:hypothetical protein [Streptomyces sp. NPDC048172]|uniref:hypothetical protein n=1 Tax=Streptomyces sp. NPDC048172 TaxID=3365505 RepID=UPI00371B001B
MRHARDPESDLITWDIADGLESRRGRQMPKALMPPDALGKVLELATKEPGRRDLYVLKDFHAFWERDHAVRRRLRNLAHKLVFTGSSLVVTTPVRTLPTELTDDAVVLEMPLPEGEALRGELDHLIDSTQGVKSTPTPAGRGRLAQARRAFAKAIVRDAVLDDRDIEAVLAEKKAVFREDQALEYYSAEESPEDLGGLDALKQWLRLRERAFSEEAPAYGLPAPKGILPCPPGPCSQRAASRVPRSSRHSRSSRSSASRPVKSTTENRELSIRLGNSARNSGLTSGVSRQFSSTWTGSPSPNTWMSAPTVPYAKPPVAVTRCSELIAARPARPRHAGAASARRGSGRRHPGHRSPRRCCGP